MEVSRFRRCGARYEYDGAGRARKVHVGDQTVETRYRAGVADGVNTVEQVAPGGYSTRQVSDVLGRVISSSDNYAVDRKNLKDGWRALSTARFDLPGNLVESIDQAGPKTIHSYNTTGALTATIASAGSRVEFSADEVAKTVTTKVFGADASATPLTEATVTTDAGGRTTQQETTFPDNSLPKKVESTEYDGWGREKTLTEDGQTIALNRDAYGRVVSQQLTGRDADSTAVQEYDGFHRPTVKKLAVATAGENSSTTTTYDCQSVLACSRKDEVVPAGLV